MEHGQEKSLLVVSFLLIGLAFASSHSTSVQTVGIILVGASILVGLFLLGAHCVKILHKEGKS